MSRIDCITAVLSVPLADPAAGPDSALLEDEALVAYFDSLEARTAALAERPVGGRSPLDEVFTALLEAPVRVDGATLATYEKKGAIYPALLFESSAFRTADDQPAEGLVDEVFAEVQVRTRLAEALGQRLGVDWVSVFVTFGRTA